MTLKLLLWIEGPLQFSIAYHLQKQSDVELYAIFDVTNKPKEFYEKQNLVKFKKIWFYHDNIKKIHKPDYEYLMKFEEKYKINLWKLAINERIFYRFYKFHKFSDEEIMSIDEDSCKLFENIFQEINPDCILTYLPAFHHLELFYELSKSFSIKTLVLSNPMLGYKTRISEGKKISESMEKSDANNSRNFLELQEYLKSFDVSKQIKESGKKENKSKKLFSSAIEYFFKSDNKHEKTHYTYFGRTKLKVLKNTLELFIKKKIREDFISKKLLKEIKTEKPFVYFPLGVEPEANILISAPFFTNQIEIIRSVAKSLPPGYLLLVKENPAQTNREWRKISEYKEMLEIPNVRVIHPSVSKETLFKNSSLVITVAGSSGLEAAFYEKPSIVFSDTIYSILSSVTEVKEIEKLPDVIRESLSKKIESRELNRFLMLLEKETFDFDLRGLNSKISNYFAHGGFLANTKISDEKMRQFLTENEKELERLSVEYMKKLRI